MSDVAKEWMRFRNYEAAREAARKLPRGTVRARWKAERDPALVGRSAQERSGYWVVAEWEYDGVLVAGIAMCAERTGRYLAADGTIGVDGQGRQAGRMER